MSPPGAVAGTARRADPAMLRVWALIGGFAIAAVLLTGTTLANRDPYVPDVHIPWLVLAAAFAFCLATSVHFEVRRQAHGVQLSQLPLVLGFFFYSPMALVAAATVGTVIVQANRRLPLVKAAFNISMIAFSTAVDVALFRWLAPHGASVSPSVWPATFASTLADDLIAALAIAFVIGIVEKQWSLASVGKVLQFAFLINVVTTSLALVAVTSLSREFDTAWMLVLLAALITVAVKLHHRLSQRHQALRQLYDFTRDLGPVAHEVDELGNPLQEIRGLLHAEQIELCLFSGETGLTRVVVAEGSVTTDIQLEDVTLDERVAGVLLTGESHLTRLHRRTPLLPRRNAREIGTVEPGPADEDMLIVPVGAPDRRIGALIAHQRSGDVRQFDQEDLTLLETVATQLDTALEKGRLVENLRRAATRDSLTGLANLDAIRAHLTGLLAQRADTAQESGVVVVFVDLDRFQDVNDTLGHDAGDRLLVDVAQRLSAAAPYEAIAARVGADKFVLVLRGSASSEVARLAAIAIKSRLDGPVRLADLSADVRVTVGIARAPDHGTDASTLLRRAEMAMSAAKGSTTGIAEWEPTHERGGPRRLAMVTALRKALADGTLDVHYQPKIELGSGRVTGMEALVRWTDPEFGPVRPDEFVPLAETCGLVGALTTNVLRKALETCRSWHEQGKPIGVAVNLSARSLNDPVLVGQVAALLTATGVKPRHLTLEITESSVMDNPERCIEVLRSLRALGVRLSIDDFGTGYSSLTYVKGLPVHELKVDKSFIDSIDRDEADRAVVRAVVELSHSLGLATVAEGVEEPEQALVLEGLGLQQVQGYFYARPMPADQATEWLRTRPAARV